jgi:hypothetical protein
LSIHNSNTYLNSHVAVEASCVRMGPQKRLVGAQEASTAGHVKPKPFI